MSRPTKMKKRALLASLAVVLILGVLGCSVDSPTAPDQVAADPPNAGADSWKISLRINPEQIPSGSDVPATVKVDVESRTDGSNPPNGTTLTLSTSLGDFEGQDSGVRSVGVSLYKGQASALLFAGDVAASGTVTARLGGSEKRDDFRVVGSVEAFITSVVPNEGSESGGTRVTISGVGFVEPLRVEFGDVYGTVVSVEPDTVVAITPRTPQGFLEDSTIECGNGGKQYIRKPVNVTVEFATGGDAVLDNGFFYTPDNKQCIGG
jgi:hypothetical protein